MLRRSAWGNICCILSTATSRDRRNASGDLLACGTAGPPKNKYLTIKPPMTNMARKYGSEIWSFAICATEYANHRCVLGTLLVSAASLLGSSQCRVVRFGTASWWGFGAVQYSQTYKPVGALMLKF